MIEVLRSGDRYRSYQDSITSWHCFSAGAHYDPDNTAFGPLVACDEHELAPGAGFARHRHVGVVIVSWPIRGRLVHEDVHGRRTSVGVGSMQRLDASAGIEHGEFAGPDEAARFVQMAVLADPSPDSPQPGAAQPAPAHLVRPVDAGTLVGVTTLRTPFGPAALSVARTGPGGADLTGAVAIDLAAHPRRFLFVTGGLIQLLTDPAAAPIALHAGDSVRATDAGPLTLQAIETARGDRRDAAEVLVWNLPG